MIDIKKLFFLNHFTTTTFKTFANKSSMWFYDNRVKESFGVLMEGAKKMDKYYFTKSTMQRVDNMDLSNIGCDDLAYLYEPDGEKCGFVFCDKDKIHFTYVITPSHIVLICLKGEKLKNWQNVKFATLKEAEACQMQDLSNHILGCLILPFYDKQCIPLPNEPYGRCLAIRDNKYLGKELMGNSKYRAEVERMIKLLEGKQKNSEHCKRTLDNMEQAHRDIADKMMLCLKMFVFLKTINVIDKTFISDGDSRTSSTRNPSEFCCDYIKVDSFYSESINVLNPFSVKGHFRNQPKKNKEGEWYKELIYIDGFVKNGYNRDATKTKIKKQNICSETKH